METICPHCKSKLIQKYGFKNNKQRFKCLACNKTFITTSKTILSYSKLDKETLKILIKMILDDTKLEAIEHVLNISTRTAYMWRMKIFKLAGYIVKDTILSDIVWIDELLIRVNKRFLVNNKTGKKFRGQSRNQIVVACAIDNLGNKYAEIIGRGHVTSNQCINSYGKHIQKGSYIIHDGIFSHDKLIEYLEVKGSEAHKSIVKSSLKFMQPINSFCSEIVRNLVVHLGTRNENLQDYFNWVVFKSSINKDNYDEKLSLLESKCFQNKIVYRVKDRYHRK